MHATVLCEWSLLQYVYFIHILCIGPSVCSSSQSPNQRITWTMDSLCCHNKQPLKPVHGNPLLFRVCFSALIFPLGIPIQMSKSTGYRLCVSGNPVCRPSTQSFCWREHWSVSWEGVGEGLAGVLNPDWIKFTHCFSHKFPKDDVTFYVWYVLRDCSRSRQLTSFLVSSLHSLLCIRPKHMGVLYCSC